LLLTMAAAGMTLPGCASTGGAQSTRLQGDDLREASGSVSEALAQSSLLSGRSPANPPMLWRLTRAENISNDRLSDTDRWMIVSRVFFAPGMLSLMRDRSVELYMPEPDAETLRRFGETVAASTQPVQHTHVVRAEVRNLSRRAGKGQLSDLSTDTYTILYTIVELPSGKTAWSDQFEIKRVAFGKIVD
jgi:hypothetical protein